MQLAHLPWPARDNQIKWLTKSGDVVVVFGFGSVLPRIHPDTKNTALWAGPRPSKAFKLAHWREAVESFTARRTAFQSQVTRPRVKNCNPLWAISDVGGR